MTKRNENETKTKRKRYPAVIVRHSRSAPLYSKKVEGSVVCSVIRELTTDTRPTSLELSNPKL